jgi:hypothetical protein
VKAELLLPEVLLLLLLVDRTYFPPGFFPLLLALHPLFKPIPCCTPLLLLLQL